MGDVQLQETDPNIFRIARHRLDGADFDWICDRMGIDVPIAQEAWEHCRLLLTQHLSGSDEPLLTDDDIFGRSEESLRLLLYWHELLETNDMFVALTVDQESTTS